MFNSKGRRGKQIRQLYNTAEIQIQEQNLEQEKPGNYLV